jgi:hypothetical protein
VPITSPGAMAGAPIQVTSSAAARSPTRSKVERKRTCRRRPADGQSRRPRRRRTERRLGAGRSFIRDEDRAVVMPPRSAPVSSVPENVVAEFRRHIRVRLCRCAIPPRPGPRRPEGWRGVALRGERR